MSSLRKLSKRGLLLGLGMFAYIQTMSAAYHFRKHTPFEKHFGFFCFLTLFGIVILCGLLALIQKLNKYIISRWSRTISDDEWIRHKGLFIALFFLIGGAGFGFSLMGVPENQHVWYSGILHVQMWISLLACCYFCSLFGMAVDHIHQISVKRNPEAYYNPWDLFNMIESMVNYIRTKRKDKKKNEGEDK